MRHFSPRPAARGTTGALLLVLFNFIPAGPAMAFVSAQEPAVTSPAGIAASNDDTAPIFVKFKSSAARSEVDAAIKTKGGIHLRDHSQLRVHELRVPAAARGALVAAYAKDPSVEWAEAAHRVVQAGSPNDPLYAQQWALPKISLDKAYGLGPVLGSAEIALLH